MSPRHPYSYFLEGRVDVRVEVEMVTEHGRLVDYSIALLATATEDIFDQALKTVRVYDNHLGAPHMHRFDRRGLKGAPEPIPGATPSEAFNIARKEIDEGFEGMVEAWRRS